MRISDVDHPFLIPTAGICTGILIATLFPLPLWTAAIPLVTAVLIGFISSRLSLEQSLEAPAILSPRIWVMLLSASMGMATAIIGRPAEYDFDNDILPPYAVGEIMKYTPGSPDRLLVRVEEFTDLKSYHLREGNLRVMLLTDATALREGDRLTWIHALRPAAVRNPSAPKYSQYLDSADIIVHSLPGIAQPLHLRIKKHLAILLEKSPLEKNLTGFLSAIILGDRDSLPENLYDEFSLLGIAHVIALSGLHLGIIASIVFIILFPLNTIACGRVRPAVAIVIIWAYIILTGMSPSIVRAGIMASFYLVSRILQRKNSSLNALLGAAFFILVFSPYALFDAGFQLSFITVASLILYGDRLNPVNPHHRMVHGITAAMATTAVAFVGSAALCIYYFHRLPLLSLPLNLIIVPAVPLFIIGGIIYLVLLSFGLNFVFPARILNWMWDSMQWLIERFASVGAGSIDLTLSLPAVAALLVLLILPALTVHLSRKIRIATLAGGFLIVAVCILFFPGEPLPDGVEVTADSSGNVLHIYSGTRMEEINLAPHGGSAIVDSKGYRLVGIEGPRWPVARDTAETRKCTHLLIGHGFKGNFADLKAIYAPRLLIFMPSLYPLEEERLMEEAERYGLECHSVREDGPFFLGNRKQGIGDSLVRDAEGLECLSVETTPFRVMPPSPLVEVAAHIYDMNQEHLQRMA